MRLRRNALAARHLCAACTWSLPLPTLLAVAAAAAGLGIFNVHTRAALSTASDAADLLAGNGLRRYVNVARDCLTAIVTARRRRKRAQRSGASVC